MKLAWLVKHYEDGEWELIECEPDYCFAKKQIVYAVIEGTEYGRGG